uniref:Large ribosomal subunit protein mL39 n=1 Tax=Lygus hesperus TaxID=30085 RepID=A0A146KQX4_LYGHE
MKLLVSLRALNPYRSYSSAAAILEKQNKLFSNELARVRNDVGRIEKIEVVYEGRPEKKKLFLNKNLSTPYNVAQHIAEWLTQQSALAQVDDTYLWDMHRPLDGSCRLKLLTVTDPDPHHVNKAFWKSCSFFLGAVITKAFSENVKVTLHSFPSPQISSGSFLYDAHMSLDEWTPTQNELRVLSAEMVKLSHQALPLERLPVSVELAKEIFTDNPFKSKQIPDIAENSVDGKIILYRIGDHIDISKGPLVGDTSFLGRCSITAVHKIESDDGPLFRFQGVALPKGLMMNHFAYRILEERASRPNSSSYNDLKAEQIG